MSTILKALQKLEREKESLQATSPVPVGGTYSSAMSGLSAWFLKPWVRWGAVGFVIVALGWTAWHFYRQSRYYALRSTDVPSAGNRHQARQVMEPPNQPAYSHSPRITRSEPIQIDRSPYSDQAMVSRQPTVPKAHPNAVGTDGHFRRTVESSIPKSHKSAPVRENRRVPAPAPTAALARDPSSMIQRPTPQRAPSEKIPASLDETEKGEPMRTNSTVQPDSASKMNAPSDTYINAPLLTDGRLKVHAIAWSPTPTDRVAVINSHVLYEGDSVEDFVVVAIRPDDVVVREKGRAVWRVEFGRPF